MLAAPWILLIFGQDYADAGTPLLRWLALGRDPERDRHPRDQRRPDRAPGLDRGPLPAAHAIAVIGLSALLLPSLGIEGVGIALTGSQTVLALAMLATILRPVLFSSARQRGNTIGG